MIERIPTRAFGKIFTHIPEEASRELMMLDRESAIYLDHWVDEIGDFRHVRVQFTEDERKEYARRTWAFELFLRADDAQWARDVPGIDEDIAADADSYSLQTIDGTVVPPPYHCYAAFLGPHLESLVCGISDRRTVLELQGQEGSLFEVRRTIETLTSTIRSFNNREQGLKPWTIEREDDVRDLLYVMLRPQIFDINKEEAIPSRADSHKFVDLHSRAIKLMLELKWVAKSGDQRRIVREIYDDIQTYVAHPSCENLWFVVIDNGRAIQDPRRLETELTDRQRILGRELDVRVFVCDT